MATIDSSASVSIRRAQRYLESGNIWQAAEVFTPNRPFMKGHPSDLHVQFLLLSEQQQWGQCFVIVQNMINQAPRNLLGWLSCNELLCALGREREAYELLKPLAELFPNQQAPVFNLVKLACRLSEYAEACAWMSKFRQLASDHNIAEAVKEDPDLGRVFHAGLLRVPFVESVLMSVRK